MNDLKIINGKRLYCKPISLEYLSEYYVNWMNDSDVNKYLESGGDYSLNKLKQFLLEIESKKIFFWAIHLKNNGKHIGNIKIDPIDYLTKSGEYGIMLGDKTEWGKGYGYEATKLILDYCFNTLELNKITLGVKKENKTAIDLYKKIGFIIYDNIFFSEKENVIESYRMHIEK